MAGFHVTGVDIKPQPRYCGDAFVQADALEFLLAYINGETLPGKSYDAIWASPPCQAYTLMRHLGKRAGENAPDLVGPVRELLERARLPWVIENVVGSPLRYSIRLCGSSFGLGVQRHRMFESSFAILALSCQHNNFAPVPVWGDGRPSRQEARKKIRPIAVYGDHPQQPGDKTYRCNRARTLKQGQQAMGIDWMEWKELTQAIPPAYGEYIGRFAMQHLRTGQVLPIKQGTGAAHLEETQIRA